LAHHHRENEKVKIKGYGPQYGSIQKGITVLAQEIRDKKK